jgi:transcription initiation factor TFIIIB Brf1 subunit/transcription initiation factor TFIIB
VARIRIGGLRLVSTPLKDKVKEYEQEEYFCEWCNLVTKEETIYHKKKKLFLCDECTIKADKGEI